MNELGDVLGLDDESKLERDAGDEPGYLYPEPPLCLHVIAIKIHP